MAAPEQVSVWVGRCWTVPSKHEIPGLVIDQPGSNAPLALAADQTRLASRLRDALTSVSRGPGAAAWRPSCTSPASGTSSRNTRRWPRCELPGRSRIERVVENRSPRIAVKVTAAESQQCLTVGPRAARRRT